MLSIILRIISKIDDKKISLQRLFNRERHVVPYYYVKDKKEIKADGWIREDIFADICRY